jgi:hypothetical protein
MGRHPGASGMTRYPPRMRMTSMTLGTSRSSLEQASFPGSVPWAHLCTNTASQWRSTASMQAGRQQRQDPQQAHQLGDNSNVVL